MMFAEAVIEVFLERMDEPRTPGIPAVQILEGTQWLVLPLEWNTAKRLAELSGTYVRIIGADDQTLATYPPFFPPQATA